MHMHAHLVFTLYVKYLQFLIFIQCTKMPHELKKSITKRNISNNVQVLCQGQLKSNLSKIFMHTIKFSMQIKENPL